MGVVRDLLPWMLAANIGLVILELTHASEAILSATSFVSQAGLLVAAGYLTRVRGGSRPQATRLAWRVCLLDVAVNVAFSPFHLLARPDLLVRLQNLQPMPPFALVLVLVIVGVIVGVSLLVLWAETWLIAGFGYWVAAD